MPAFTAVGVAVVGWLGGAAVLGTVGAAIIGAVVATGAAYITSRIINGNQNKGNNSAVSQGGRIQVPPATNNKIPVVYGSAYVNGIITDARLVNENKTMYYCIVLSEYTNNLTTPVYGLESVLWNDLRLTAVDTTTNAHKVKDGRKVVDGAIVTAGSFVVGKTYIITSKGTTDFTAIGAQTNNIGQIFEASGAGTGTGTAQEEDFIDTNFIVEGNSLVQLRVYAGSSAASSQIYPAQSTGNTVNAYDFWGGDDNSWTNQFAMKGLVFAIVKLDYNGDKGFTALPNVTFQLANNVSNPADVWYDYMTSERYGAGIPSSQIDSTARTAWYNFCEEDITYTNVAGETNQSTLRYNINGVIDTSNQVKTNIDIIMQNGGAWLSYDVTTGLWSPVIKKANSAGQGNKVAKQFTASRSGSTLTVGAFPSGRIENGQRLYSVGGTYIGTISGQIFPLLPGETTGQTGRYTTSSSGTITTTTFYTLPASSLEFGDDNIISGITLSSTRLEDLYNEVEVEFYNRYNKDQRAYFRNAIDAADRNPNEPDNELRMSLELCNNSMQADILGQLELRQSRDDLVIEFTSNHYGIQTQAGDIIAVTSDLYGWNPKYFRAMRVKEIEGDDGGLVANIQALEYNPDVYTIEPITEFSTSENIGIGNLVSSRGLPKPDTPTIGSTNPSAPIPFFTYNQLIPTTGGPFDEIEIYFTEGWDPFNITGTIVAGTGSNGAPVGKGLLTVSAATYNAINKGDFLTISTSGDVTVVEQVLPLIGSEVLKGKGRYVVTVANLGSLPISGTTLLYDKPLDEDFKYLKKAVPAGNASSFVGGTIINVVITELPANTATYRRWFMKSRLGWKKNFGDFSDNQTIDLDGNLQWEPDPAGSSADVLNIKQALVKMDFGYFIIPRNGLWLMRTTQQFDQGRATVHGDYHELDLGDFTPENAILASDDIEDFVFGP